MKKQVYQLDTDCYLKEIYVAEVDLKGNIVDEDKQGFVVKDPPDGLYRPKWIDDEWIEGETEEEKAERESQQLIESLKPSPSEIADAELEIKMLTMLTDLGVIQ